MRSGLLRCKVRVLAATEDRGDYGESTPEWNPIEESPRRASIRPLTLRDQERLAHEDTVVQQEITHQIRMRWFVGLTSANRLEGLAPDWCKGIIYELASVANVAGRSREWEILAREIVE